MVTCRVAMPLRMKHTEHLVNNEIMMPQDLNLLGSMIFGKDKMNSYLYRFLLLAVPLI